MGRVTEFIDFLNRNDTPRRNEYKYLTISHRLKVFKHHYKKNKSK